MHHKDYEIWISCEGKRLPEYNVQLEGGEGKTVACFIPSERNKAFEINWRNNDREHTMDLVFTIDGARMSGGSYSRPGRAGERKGVWTSPTSRRPFLFSALKTTDDDSVMARDHNLSDLGSIKIKVTHVVVQPQKVPWKAEMLACVDVVHERTKKAGTHSVALGAAKLLSRESESSDWRVYVDPVNPSGGAAAVFIFRYRPLDLLKAQGIARSPSAKEGRATPPNTNDRNMVSMKRGAPSGALPPSKHARHAADNDSDNDDEVKALPRPPHGVKIKNAVSKKQKASGHVEKEIKTEPHSVFPVDSAGIIDLTSLD